MDRFTCTCNGENANCFKCFGTGMMPHAPQIREPGDHQWQRWSPKVSLPKQKPEVTKQSHYTSTKMSTMPVQDTKCDRIICPICRIDFHFRDFIWHKRQDHSPVNILKRRDQVPKPSRKAVHFTASKALHECPECKAQVADLQKHSRKVHNAESQLRRQARQKWREHKLLEKKFKVEQQRIDLGIFVKYKHTHPNAKICGFCRALLPDLDKLQVHFRNEHGLEPKVHILENARSTTNDEIGYSPSKKSTDSKAASNQKASTGSINPFAQEDRERRMDATYGMGGTAREQGRFGSSASYDGMDDESSP
jgi:hypothetical protein